MIDVRLFVAGFADSDVAERVELARLLRHELLQLDLCDVSFAHQAASAPRGDAREMTPKGAGLEWATLAVTAIGSLAPLVSAVRSWLARNPRSSVTLEINGDQLTLADATPDECRQLIAAWMARHGE